MNPFQNNQQPQYNPFSPNAQPQFQAPQGANPQGGQPFAPQQFQAPPQGFQAPQSAAPIDFANMFAGMGAADESGENLPPLPPGGHKRIRVGNIKIEPSSRPGKGHIVFFKADLTVVESASCAPGTRSIFIERITGHDFPSYKADSLARIRCFVAGAMGRDGNSAEVRAEFNDPAKYTAIMQGVMQGALLGKELACPNVAHKVTKPTPQKPQGGLVASYSWAPLGTPVSAAVAAPVAVQAPAQAQGLVFPPIGWSLSQQYPGYYTGTVNGQSFTVSENDLRAAVAAGKV